MSWNPSVSVSLLCPLLRKWQADTRGLVCFAFCGPHQRPDCELPINVSWRGETLVWQRDRYQRWPTVDPLTWGEWQGRHESAGQSMPTPSMANSTKRIAFSSYQQRTFPLPWPRFSVNFLSCKANARVYLIKSEHGPHSPRQARRLNPKRLTKVAFAIEPVWARNPDSQTSKFIIKLRLKRTSLWPNQSRPLAWLQNR
jgi:hypothetical protein